MATARVDERLAVLRCEISALRAELAQEGRDTIEVEELLNRLVEELETLCADKGKGAE